MKHILVFPSWYPTFEMPNSYTFIKKHVELLNTKVVFSEKKNKVFQVIDTVIKGIGMLFRYGLPFAVWVHVAWPAGLYGLLFSKLLRVPLFITEHYTGYLPLDGRIKRTGFKWKLIKLIFGNARTVMPVSAYLGKHLPVKDFTVVPNVIISERYKEFPDLVHIVVVSRLDEWHKQIKEVIEVFNSLPDPNLRLHIIGDGPDKEMYKSIADSRTLFWGDVTNVNIPYIMQTMSFLVSNSRFETFGVGIAEAIANGIPVVCRYSEALDYINVDNGIVADDIRQGILQMIQRHRDYNKDKLIKSVKQFSPEAVKKQLENAFKS